MDKLKILLKKYHDKYSAFPSQKYISNSLNISLEEVKKQLTKLLTQGVIQKQDNKLFIPDPAALEVKEKIIDKVKGISINKFVRTIFFIISISLTIISIRYTWYWLHNYLAEPFAILLASTLVVYAVFSWQAFKIIGKNNVLKFAISSTALIVIIFSMVSTVAGQYNSRITISNESIEFLNYQSREKEIQEDIADIKKELSRLQNIIDEIDTPEKRVADWWTYQQTQIEMNENKKYLKDKEHELKGIRKKIDNYLSENKKKLTKTKQSFYVWLAQIFGWSPDIIEFWLSMLPAIAIDVLAPLCMVIALYPFTLPID
jgi:DNA-binding Lrp family transcriptional regulator